MTIDELVQEGARSLSAANVSDARHEAAVLLGDLLGMDRLRLRSRADDPVDPERTELFRDRVRRRAKREPVAYILGYRDFYDSRFRVTPAVLVPRPETETLVELALDAELDPPRDARVLDLCCGSGCVGISLKKARPAWRVLCADLSRAALDVARENAAALCPADARPEFIESDLFAEISQKEFDAILCNPPYIDPDEAGALAPELGFEPREALFHDDSFAFAVRILRESAARLRPGGLFAMETSPRWAADLKQEAGSFFATSRVLRDLNGLDRILTGRPTAD